MKRFMLMMCAMLSVLVASAQGVDLSKWRFHVAPTVYGGYNCLESTPVAGIAIPVYAGLIRAEAELSYNMHDTSLGHYNYFTYAHYFGMQYGNDKIKGYALIGATTWPCITRVGAPYYQGDEDYFSVCDIQGKIKCGVDVTLYKKLFLNAELGYVLVSDGGQYYETFNQLAVRIGIGWRFGFKHA